MDVLYTCNVLIENVDSRFEQEAIVIVRIPEDIRAGMLDAFVKSEIKRIILEDNDMVGWGITILKFEEIKEVDLEEPKENATI